MNRLLSKLFAGMAVLSLLLGISVTAGATSAPDLVNEGCLKSESVMLFNFDTDVNAWTTSRLHTIDVEDAREGSGCYAVTYSSAAATHALISSQTGAFELNVKDPRHTALELDMYLSDFQKISPLSTGGNPTLTLQVTDINQKNLIWRIPCTQNGWKRIDAPFWQTDAALNEEAVFNFNHIVSLSVIGTVSAGLTVKFDNLRVINYTNTYQLAGPSYQGRWIAGMEQGALEGMAYSHVSGAYTKAKAKVVSGQTAWQFPWAKSGDAAQIQLRTLAMNINTKEDVLVFSLYLPKAKELTGYSLTMSENSGHLLKLSSMEILKSCANGGEGLKDGLNRIRIPLSELEITGEAVTRLNRFSLAVYGATSEPETSSQEEEQKEEEKKETVVDLPAVDAIYLTTKTALTEDAGKLGAKPSMGTPAELRLSYENPAEDQIVSAEATLITGTTATLTFTVNGTYALLQAGVYWGDVNYQLSSKATAHLSDPNSHTVTLDLVGLQGKKNYYFRPFIVTEKGEVQGEIVSFTTTTGLAITTRCSDGGSVSPSGITTVEKGGALTVTITPREGFYLSGLTVDDVFTEFNKENGITEYHFSDISDGHVLYAEFTSLTEEPTQSQTQVSSQPGGMNGSDDDPEEEDDPLRILLWVILALALLSIILMLLLPFLAKKDRQKNAAAAATPVAEPLPEQEEEIFPDEEVPMPPVILPTEPQQGSPAPTNDTPTGGFTVNLDDPED